MGHDEGSEAIAEGQPARCTGIDGFSCVCWMREGACPHVPMQQWCDGPPPRERISYATAEYLERQYGITPEQQSGRIERPEP